MGEVGSPASSVDVTKNVQRRADDGGGRVLIYDRTENLGCELGHCGRGACTSLGHVPFVAGAICVCEGVSWYDFMALGEGVGWGAGVHVAGAGRSSCPARLARKTSRPPPTPPSPTVLPTPLAPIFVRVRYVFPDPAPGSDKLLIIR